MTNVVFDKSDNNNAAVDNESTASTLPCHIRRILPLSWACSVEVAVGSTEVRKLS